MNAADFYAAAQLYSAQGWRVFPVHVARPGMGCSCGDVAECRPGKHPVLKGWQAGVPPEQFANGAQRNIGIATGPASGIVVIDVDPAHGGDDTLSLLEREFGLLPPTVEARSGSGGRHLYFRYPSGAVVRNEQSGKKLGLGVDVRGDGGYIVAAPSLHPLGGRYEWIVPPGGRDLAELPQWMLSRIRDADAPPESSSNAKDSRPIRDDDDAIRIAIDYLARCPPAIDGSGGHDKTWAAALAVVRGCCLSEERGFALLWEHYNPRCRGPWSEKELRHKVEGAANDGRVPWGYLLDAKPPLTDSGNAERLVCRYGVELRYCHPWSKWLVWDGARWKVDDTGQVDRFAKGAVRAIPEEVADEEDGDRRGKVLAHAIRSEGSARRQAMISLARAEPKIPVTPEELDADQMLLNVGNGTIDLRTGKLRPHDRADLITKLAPVDFDPTAQCPTWERFLARIMDGNEELIVYLQRAAGYSLTGDVTAHALFFAHGGGANGKSTFLNTLMRLLGDYAVKAPAEILLAKRGERHPTDMTMLHGARLAVCQEANEGRRFDLAAVKGLTGGDPITARRMREDFWTFQPTAKPWLATNSKPRVPESDEATWRRIQLIPFEVTIPENERDAALGAKLALELPGILLWALEGCRAWQEKGGGLKGLAMPDAVREATTDYRRQEDSIGAFIDEECILMAGAKTPKPQLYDAFTNWCKANSEHSISKHDFNARIGLVPGIDGKGHSGGARTWKGIALKAGPAQTENGREMANA